MEDREGETAEGEYETDIPADLHAAPPTRLRVMPLLVYRSRVAGDVRLLEISRTPQVRPQVEVLHAFVRSSRAEAMRMILLHRTNAAYFPARDPTLTAAIEEAGPTTLLLIDDLFRLIDCRHIRRAREGIDGLRHLEAPIFSIVHGIALAELPERVVDAEILRRVSESSARSAKVKEGLARYPEFRDPPTREVIEKAVRAKKQRADTRAAELVLEIQRVRAGLPEEARSNRQAIAAALNAAGVATPSRLGAWQGTTVKRVLDRVGRTLDD